jgi:ketosteroid isomerase-like protein
MKFSAQSLLTDIYDAWRANDLDRFATYLPDDFSHYINIPVELHPLGEARHGKAAALERLKQIFQQFQMQRLETASIAVGDNSATVEVRKICLHRESGVLFDISKMDLWTLEGGWPVKLFEHYDLDQFKAFAIASAQRGAIPRL